MLPSLFNFFHINISFVFCTFFAFFTSLAAALLCGGKLISFLKKHQGKGQPIRRDGPQSHLATKQGTPTMGGLLIIGSTLLSTLLWCRLDNPFVWTALTVFIVYALIGFADDFVKIKKQSSSAVSGPMRLLLEFSTAFAAVLVISFNTPETERFILNIPYFQNLAFNLCWFYIPFAMFVLVGTANSVNLSDGLDGLAGGLCVIALSVFMIFAAVCDSSLTEIFSISPVKGGADIAVICAAAVGGCVGFLWFNAPPAKIFMGDTGSLALGGLLGTIALTIRQEIILAVVGGIFVMEALSDIIQVFWYRRTGRRVFLMAPIHHHFEQLGWKETTVVLRFWIIGLILALVGLLSLFMTGE